MLKNKCVLLILSNAFFIGCTVGPKYEPPFIEVPCDWQSPISNGIDTGEEEDSECFNWWEALNDPYLNSLIERAYLQNLDLSIAATRILQARTIQKKSKDAARYPHIDASATCGHAEYNNKAVNNILGCSSNQRNTNFFVAGFDAQWEIDFFGKDRHEINALKANTEAVFEEYRGIWITVTAEIAQTYIELRSMQARLSLINKNIDLQNETIQLIEGLLQTGFSSSIDQYQAEEQLNVFLAEKPIIESSIYKSTYRLSILLGLNPGELFDELNESFMFPQMPCQKPIGIPSELLRRRPDIRKVERDLAAATERVGSAIAALFPRISLYGFIGEITAFCSGNGFSWLAGPQALLPILNSELLEQDVALNKIKVQQALLEYRKTVLSALEETENAIASFHFEFEKNVYLKEASSSSKKYFELTKQLYEIGFKDYLEVLMTERSHLNSENAYLDSQTNLLFHYIALYKALGGCW